MGIDERVVDIQADEMAETMRHEHTMQIEGEGAVDAAGHKASRDEVAEQNDRSVAVHFIVVRALMKVS